MASEAKRILDKLTAGREQIAAVPEEGFVLQFHGSGLCLEFPFPTSDDDFSGKPRAIGFLNAPRWSAESQAGGGRLVWTDGTGERARWTPAAEAKARVLEKMDNAIATVRAVVEELGE